MTSTDNINWPGVGKVLLDGRTGRSLSQDSVAKNLCLSVKQVRALECGSGVSFPGPSARSWCARRFARLLELDWDKILISQRNEEPREVEPRDATVVAPPAETVAAPVRQTSGKLRAGMLLATVVLLVAIVIAITIGTNETSPLPSTAVTPIREAALPEPTVAASDVMQTEPHDGGPDNAAVQPAVEATPPASAASAAPQPDRTPVAAAAPAPPPPVEKVIRVQGLNANKSPDYFFINSNEPSVLMKKQQQAESEGVRIDFARGAAQRVPIASGEVIRVVEGKNVEIFYQGRMLPPQAIARGDWARFVPKPADVGN